MTLPKSNTFTTVILDIILFIVDIKNLAGYYRFEVDCLQYLLNCKAYNNV